MIDPNSLPPIPLTVENLLIYVPILFSAIVTVATLIVRLTPTLKDDNILLPVIKWIAKYPALNTKTPTERPK